MLHQKFISWVNKVLFLKHDFVGFFNYLFIFIVLVIWIVISLFLIGICQILKISDISKILQFNFLNLKKRGMPSPKDISPLKILGLKI